MSEKHPLGANKNGALRTSKQRNSWKELWRHKQLYIMLLPCLIFFILFSYMPMAGLVLAFKEFKFNTGIWGGEWVGFTYFERFFKDPQSWVFIKNTLIISSMKLFLGLPFPILLALMFKEISNNKIRNLLQGITYLPHFLSWVIIVGLLQRVLAPDTGLLNQVIQLFGGKGDTFFLMERDYFYPVMFWSHVWKEIGWNSIIYFAAIAGINPEFYEAAKIDGASKLRQIWHVTLPCIRPTIIILFILSLGNILSAGFDQIYLLKTPGNADVAEIIDTYVIRVGLQGGQFGYATAVGMLQGVIGLMLVLVVNAISKRKFDTSLW
ncbi:ABC transporter permease [Bacillus sp. FSL K6-3431]|uniref:ABC transporter permease n=1 Tax=Bacillus sp. FSL K6-3431 TaxID=2921500 RepID=UPI0030F87B2F